MPELSWVLQLQIHSAVSREWREIEKTRFRDGDATAAAARFHSSKGRSRPAFKDFFFNICCLRTRSRIGERVLIRE